MGYSVKWVMDNLGITRKALRNYEAKGLMENPYGQNRDYDDNDINLIWCIKLLQGVGFSVKEIKAMMDDPDTDFYEAISSKVEDLERQRADIDQYIGFAKTIKMTGRIPTVSEVGSMRFQDFIKYARENWNVYGESEAAPFLDVMEAETRHGGFDPESITEEQLDRWMGLLENYRANQHDCMIIAYYRILGDLRALDYRNEVVQTVVRQLFDFIAQDYPAEVAEGRFNANFFARYTVPSFMPGSDLYLLQERNYGSEACRFIAEAISFFGDYDTLQEND